MYILCLAGMMISPIVILTGIVMICCVSIKIFDQLGM
jgi:hypothetical protein